MSIKGTTNWRTIGSAPRDGQLILLCVSDFNNPHISSPIDDKNVGTPRCLVGWWATDTLDTQSGWVSDLRLLEHQNSEEYNWVTVEITPTHWMQLPHAPPSTGWYDSLKDLPSLKNSALLFDPEVQKFRVNWMDGFDLDNPTLSMVVGRLINNQPNFLPQWTVDLVGEETEPVFSPSNEGLESDYLYAENVVLMPPYWYELPSLPPTCPKFPVLRNCNLGL